MADSVQLKYRLPSIRFNAKPAYNQHFRIDYGIDTENVNTIQWELYNNDITFTPDGVPTQEVVFTNLQPYTPYIIRFTSNIGTKTYKRFKTGQNIALSDSPYYNKTLFPGQIYDWFIEGVEKLGLPNKEETPFFYRLAGKKSESVQVDNWGNMINMTESSGYYVVGTSDVKFEAISDKMGDSMTAMILKGDNKFLATPYVKFVSDTSTGAWDDYWETTGGGGITARSVLSNRLNVCFSFCIKEVPTEDMVLAGMWNTKNKLISSEENKWELAVTPEMKLKTSAIAGAMSNSVTDSNVLELNRWYFIILGDSGYTIYYNNDGSMGQFNVSGGYLVGLSLSGFGFGTSSCPFYLGSPTTKDIAICNFGTISLGVASSVADKCVFNGKYKPVLKISGIMDGVLWEYTSPSGNTMGISPEKVSFLVDPNIFDSIPLLSGKTHKDTGVITIDMMAGGIPYATKNLPGITLGTENVGGLINNSAYLTGDYDLDFSSMSNPLASLQKYFFTKHGTWGGYNGGVNGHNIYFNSDKHLILECHGDDYTGQLKGVSKESVVKPYTGYGGDLDLSAKSFDRRTNKECLRTGTALVSSKYHGYGRVDITMKIPVGTWGVCPAIWYFHYIELGDGDSRYSTSPYSERNEQGSYDGGFYRVVNNEIDIELPSHLTNGTLSSWDDLSTAYFDPVCIDNQLTIGVEGEGLFRLQNVLKPNEVASWVKVSNSINPRYRPSFQNCKFNNWVGELNSGNGWVLPTGGDTAEQYYKGTGNNPNEKEEYCSQLTHLSDNSLGYADGKFHKWSIVWLPDRVILLVDDKIIRTNKGFIPFNQMALTIAMWFPTMKANNNGAIDRDGIHGTKGSTILSLTDSPSTSIGTWAGTRASFDVCHLEISRIKYQRYYAGHSVTVNGETINIESEPQSLGESFPESGLRMFVNKIW